MSSSVILINKELGITSAHVVAKLKRKFNLKKIGHAGTLDPDATGLLVCVTGHAPRILPHMVKSYKTYTGTILLGVETDTDDITGRVIGGNNNLPTSIELIREKARNFIGLIKQQPPRYSAVKVNGQRAYKLARADAKMDLAFKEVEVRCFDLSFKDQQRLEYTINCASGTYVRALARDLGNVLGCGACAESINRSVSDPFSIEQAKFLDQVELSDFLPWNSLLPNLPVLDFSPEEILMLRNGDLRVFLSSNFANRSDNLKGNVLYRQSGTDEFLGLLNNDHGNWKILVNV
jgi:tRNA pseudouridine55 synthase